MQEPQPLGCHLLVQKIDAGRIAAGPGEAGYKTLPDRVIANAKDDRNRRGCSFCRQCGHVTYRGHHSDLSANQIGHQSR
jgi:hypothetical protein